MRPWLIYGMSMVLYIVITLFTKRLLSWNLALAYFIVTIDLIPRLVRRAWAGLRAGGDGR